MGGHVESHNQSGGITGYHVNVQGQENKPKLKKRYGTFIVTAVFIIAAVVGILTYFGIQPNGGKMNPNNNEERDINVTSHNQSGGITAYNVNIHGNQPRRFNDEAAQNLAPHLPSDRSKTIMIDAAMGDGEAFQFASEIKEYLISEGWNVNGVNQVVWSQPVSGQRISPQPDGGIQIIIGSRN